VLGMDDDLQTHPSQIPILVKKIEEGYDLVYGVYRNSTNTKKKNLTSWFNKVSSRILLGRPKEIRSSNFWLITSKVRDEVIKYTNNNPYVDGIFFRTTHNIANVEIEHHKREYGASGYTFRKMLKLWMAYWNFSVVPLRLASFMGIITAFMGFIATIVTIISKLIDPSAPIGWPSLICVILVFFGFTLLVLGIIGEYIGELILAINRTPQFIVRDTVNLETKTTEV
jgi:undecaprenyl-phosphate 4-deoxy-4-formamido-L-arabinose transferase